MHKNFEVLALLFGTYPRGSVIPAWCAANYSKERLAELIKDGVLAETNRPVNVEIVAPKSAVADMDSGTEMVIESNWLRQENDRLQTVCAGYEGQIADQLKLIESYKKTLGDQTAEISRLQGILTDLEIKNSLIANAMTAPAEGGFNLESIVVGSGGNVCATTNEPPLPVNMTDDELLEELTRPDPKPEVPPEKSAKE